ncbi:hypothetical protein [Botryobacter ruber]|uniref:hypothetical protein n=1 Tax=Botryobacter ruber TaxID=2171629 RepID=UPI000E0C0302|nr:hypothetical protein [Botryobacter ruber]
MILFQNTIIKLDYNPATDILEVEYPNLHVFLLPEIKHSITIMAEYIRNYDVKRLILDSSKTTVSVSAEESRDVALFLAEGLMKTRLQKVARVQSVSSSVESTARENIKQINQNLQLTFQLRNFTHKADAVKWLQGINTE